MTPEEQAQSDIAQEKQIRELAAQIGQMSKLPYTPDTIRKGVIASVNHATTPPTVSINISGDTTTLVGEVRTLDNYSPVVNQTVLVMKQGSEIFILGAIAASPAAGAPVGQEATTGWIKATLSNGTHGGTGSDVYYRRILDHGSWKVQWRGVWNTSGSVNMISSGDALGDEYQPSNYRAIACARENDGSVTSRMDFNADGTVTLHVESPNTFSASGSTTFDGSHGHDFNDIYGATGEFATANGTFSSGSHNHGVSSHSHGVDVDHPNWVSLNGVEYFL